jgi:hypothetical protein
MSVVDYLRNSEQAIYDFNTPWSMAIVVLGFLSAWLVTNILEHLGLTRHVWHLPLWPKINLSRLRDGFKPAIAGTVALLICQWFNPPDAAAIPLTALALTFMNKSFIGSKGDRGALQSAFQVSVGGLIFVILVFWISPALSNYGMMNLFLFTELFAFGYWSAALGGQNIHAGAVMFFIIASVGLDAEKPVAVQTVFGSYFGIVLPIFMAAIVGRLFWPVLPEAELRKRFVDFFSICSNFLTKQPGHGDEMLSERLSFIPIESLSWAKGLKGRHCPGIEVEKIVTLTLTMRRLALRLSARAQAESLGLPEGITRLSTRWLSKRGRIFE